jgi:hypothetical protein
VLHNDDRGHVWLFFSESHADCVKPHVEGRVPQRYVIGGDIKVARLNLASQRWSPAVTLYSQDLDGNIPKLTANKLLVLRSGEWVLPFWRERSGLVRPPPPPPNSRLVRKNSISIQKTQDHMAHTVHPLRLVRLNSLRRLFVAFVRDVAERCSGYEGWTMHCWVRHASAHTTA